MLAYYDLVRVELEKNKKNTKRTSESTSTGQGFKTEKLNLKKKRKGYYIFKTAQETN